MVALVRRERGITVRVPSVGKGSTRRPENRKAFETGYDRVFNRDKLYGSKWRRARRIFLAEHPLCVMCEQEGKTEPATEVDHIERHRGDKQLFWDVENWQGLCAFHHRSIKAQMERSGKIKGSKADGTPIDPNHHWTTR